MANNVTLSAGTADGAVIATDDIGAVHYPYTKIGIGADDTFTILVGGAGAVAAGVQRVTLASDDPAVTDLAAIEVLLTTQAGYLDGIETLIGTTNTNTGNAATSLSVLDDWDNAASDGVSVSGDVAHDAVDAGEPVKIGGYAKAAAPTDVSADGDRVNAWFDLAGRLQVGDGGGSLTVDGTVAVTNAGITTIAGAVSGTEMQVDVLTSALPTGAATAAKQPALGTAGTASSDVITVQGIASMTALVVDGSGVTQPVSHAALTELAAAINASSQMDVNLAASNATVTVDLGVNNDVTVTGTVDLGATDNAVLDAIAASLALLDNAIPSGNELQVDVVGALPAGTNNIGDVDIASITAGDNVIGRVKLSDGTDVADILDLTNSNPLTVAIVDGDGSQITSFGGGTQYTEDAAAAANPVGTVPILIRKDTPAGVTTTDGDNVAQRGTDYGAAYVQVVDSSGNFVDSFGGSGGTAAADDADFTATSTQGTPAMGVYESTPSSVTDGDMGIVGITQTRALRTAVEGTVAVSNSGLTELAAAINGSSQMDVNIAANGIGLATSAKQDTIIGHVDGIEGLLGTIDTDTGNIVTSVQLLDDTVATLGTSTYTETTTKGLIIGAVRRDADTTLVNTTNEIGPLQMDAAGRLKVEAFSGETLPVSLASLPALAAGTNGIGKLTANSGVDIGDVDVTSISAGTNAIGNVGLIGRTTGGMTIFRSIDIDESEEEVKATAGQVFSITAFNTTAAPLYLKFYNATAANTTVGTTTPVLTFLVPGNADSDGAGFVWNNDIGWAFGTAISVACTTGVADADTGAPGANACLINVGYV